MKKKNTSKRTAHNAKPQTWDDQIAECFVFNFLQIGPWANGDLTPPLPSSIATATTLRQRNSGGQDNEPGQ